MSSLHLLLEIVFLFLQYVFGASCILLFISRISFMSEVKPEIVMFLEKSRITLDKLIVTLDYFLRKLLSSPEVLI